MSEQFGTRESPREVHGILGPGGGGGGGAARTVIGNGTGSFPAQEGEAARFGTRDTPREVKEGAPANRGQDARVVGSQAIRRMGKVARPAAVKSNVQRAAAVRKVESHGVRGGTQGATVDSEMTEQGPRLSSSAPQGRAPQGGVATNQHLKESLTLVHPGEGERVIVINKGAAESLKRFFQSHATVGRMFWATIARSISDAMLRPKGEAGPSGLMEIAVVVRQEDMRGIQMACRRVQPSQESRARLRAAFEKAFRREREMNEAVTLDAQDYSSGTAHPSVRMLESPDEPAGSADELENEPEGSSNQENFRVDGHPDQVMDHRPPPPARVSW